MHRLVSIDTRKKIFDLVKKEVCQFCDKKDNCVKVFYCDEIMKIFNDIEKDKEQFERGQIYKELNELNIALNLSTAETIRLWKRDNYQDYKNTLDKLKYVKYNYKYVAIEDTKITVMRADPICVIETKIFKEDSLAKVIEKFLAYMYELEI